MTHVKMVTILAKISATKDSFFGVCMKCGCEICYICVCLLRRPDFYAQRLGCMLSVSAFFMGDYSSAVNGSWSRCECLVEQPDDQYT